MTDNQKPLSERAKEYRNHITSISGHVYAAIHERHWKKLLAEILTLERKLEDAEDLIEAYEKQAGAFAEKMEQIETALILSEAIIQKPQ